MGFGTPPTVICAEDVLPCLEGDFSDWSIYDSFSDSDSFDYHLYQDASFNRAETKILLLNILYATVRTYDIPSKTLGDVQASFYGYDLDDGCPNLPKKSAYGTYHVVLAGRNMGLKRIHIFKGGVLIKTLDEADLGIASDKVRNVAISPTGKYIVVSGYLLAPINHMGWVVFEGS